MATCRFCNQETAFGRRLHGINDPDKNFVCDPCSTSGEIWAIEMALKENQGRASPKEVPRWRLCDGEEMRDRNNAEVIRGLKEALEIANQRNRLLIEEINVLKDELRKHTSWIPWPYPQQGLPQASQPIQPAS